MQACQFVVKFNCSNMVIFKNEKKELREKKLQLVHIIAVTYF